MPEIELIDPGQYRRTPWRNGGGVLITIAGDGGDGWGNGGVAWHYGRTSIVEAGPFSDLTGYDRLQVVIKGTGLVLVSPTSEIDLRKPFQPVRYDGGTPIVTHLENGAVEVANLIADRKRFRIDLRAGATGEALECLPGEHILHAATESAAVKIMGLERALAEDHAIRLRFDSASLIKVTGGKILIASIYRR